MIIAEVPVAELAKAIKSSLVFAGEDNILERYGYLRFDAFGYHLYVTSGDRYQVAAVRVLMDQERTKTAVYVTAESAKAAFVWLKPGRTKPLVQLRANEEEDGGFLPFLYREDTKESFPLIEADDPSALPPAFYKPSPPIDFVGLESWTTCRFAVSPELITKVTRAAQNPGDAILVESGGLPHSPITFRIGSYMVAVLAPKDGRNGNTTVNAPNDEETRRSWHQALTALKLTRD